jgi:hypothetical protein
MSDDRVIEWVIRLAELNECDILSERSVVEYTFGKFPKTWSYKDEEAWGHSIISPRFSNTSQWMHKLSELVCVEIFDLFFSKNLIRSKGYERRGKKAVPDFETESFVIEVKGGTYLMNGTAHEKIPTAMLKYCNATRVMKKQKLIVFTFGRAEKYMKEEFGVGSKDDTLDKNEREQFDILCSSSCGVFIGASFLLRHAYFNRNGSLPV